MFVPLIRYRMTNIVTEFIFYLLPSRCFTTFVIHSCIEATDPKAQLEREKGQVKITNKRKNWSSRNTSRPAASRQYTKNLNQLALPNSLFSESQHN
jgi:hypothetical protein